MGFFSSVKSIDARRPPSSSRAARRLVRDRVCERLAFLGPLEVRVVRAREELVIARAVEATLT